MFFGLLICSLITISYVASIYVWKLTPWHSDDRLNEMEILRRSFSCTLSTFLSLCIYIFCYDGYYTFNQHESWMGFLCAVSWGLILFNGLIHEEIRLPSRISSFQSPVLIFRSLLIAPFLEELCFRVVITGILEQAGCNRVSSCLLSCFFFVVAHIHPFLQLKPLPLIPSSVIPQLRGQIIVTLIFSFLSFCIFKGTGSLLGVIVVHSMCNYFQAPSFSYLNPKHPLNYLKIVLNLQHLIGVIFAFIIFPFVTR
eukprot:GDKJ01020397.1.p1 GENE.GDKJ01020397.1~~GDKJ01020397.1.p1  ORF type:complete len:254 (+),score=2.24 GDKJ01020397.1:41-802(+)